MSVLVSNHAQAGVKGLRIPSAYQAGYERAATLNPGLAAKYIEYTTVGDPVADAVVEALSPFGYREVERFINAGMERDEKILAEAPSAFRDFFDELETPPGFFDRDAVLPGRRAFQDYSDLFIPAFFVTTLQNETTMISKAFYMTGRVTSSFGPRRIKQNFRHFIEVMLPGSLERQGDGWKLSVRVRLVHAQARRLIRASGEWDEDLYGTPLSLAHMVLAAANFSAGMLRHVQALGAKIDEEARNAYMQIWQYVAWLLGLREKGLFESNAAKATELSRVAHLCEPPISEESRVIVNALVQALPTIAGRTEPDAQRAMIAHVYRVSRALLGDELADQLGFPRQSTVGVLTWMRCWRRVLTLSHRVFPSVAAKWRGENFAFLLEASLLDDLSYRLPDHLKTEQATPW